MAVTDSRVRKGILTLDGQAFSCQPTSVSINPGQTTGNTDELEVLCGDKITDATSGEVTATLDFTAIQDFTDAAGLIAFSWTHNGQTVDFEWQPTGDATDKWTGKVVVQALQVGGEVGARLTNDASWSITELHLPPRLGGQQVIPASLTVAITGVTAGTPGSFQPGHATIPADLTALKANSVVGDAALSGTAAWTSTQYVTLADGSQAHWDGSAWVTGAAS